MVTRSSEIHEFLKGSDLFRALTDEELIQIVPLCSTRAFNKGEWIFKQGERLDAVSLIKRGRVGLVRHSAQEVETPEKGVTLEELGIGRMCGWSTFVAPYISTLSARALVETELLMVEGPSLRALMERNRAIDLALTKRLVELLSHRVRQAYTALDQVK